MKTVISNIVLLLLISCGGASTGNNLSGSRDTVVVHDTVYLSPEYRDWQEGFGLSHDPDKDSIWFKPVSYYLSDPSCSGLAADFYYGNLKPSDNGATDELLKLAATGNDKLRPFYRWCLNKTIMIQDGALAEHTGIPARKYAEKFPEDFFQYMDSDTSGMKYEAWVEAIGYSGFYDADDYQKPGEIRKRLVKEMAGNCKGCDAGTLSRIEKFAKDCFE